MNAKYSIIVIVVVALLLTVNSLWLSQSVEPICINCDKSN